MIGKKEFRYIISVISAVILISCSSGFRPADSDMRDVNCGKVYTQEQAQEMVLENLKWMFKNYESAKIEFSELKKAYIYYELGDRNIFGYSIKAIVNSKNSEGVYGGDRNHLFFIRDDKVYYNYTNPNAKLRKAYWVEVRPDISN